MLYNKIYFSNLVNLADTKKCELIMLREVTKEIVKNVLREGEGTIGSLCPRRVLFCYRDAVRIFDIDGEKDFALLDQDTTTYGFLSDLVPVYGAANTQGVQGTKSVKSIMGVERLRTTRESIKTGKVTVHEVDLKTFTILSKVDEFKIDEKFRMEKLIRIPGTRGTCGTRGAGRKEDTGISFPSKRFWNSPRSSLGRLEVDIPKLGKILIRENYYDSTIHWITPRPNDVFEHMFVRVSEGGVIEWCHLDLDNVPVVDKEKDIDFEIDGSCMFHDGTLVIVSDLNLILFDVRTTEPLEGRKIIMPLGSHIFNSHMFALPSTCEDVDDLRHALDDCRPHHPFFFVPPLVEIVIDYLVCV